MTLLEQCTEVVKLNEIGDADPYRFDDPDGLRSGKSGWSFGPCQFDIANNSAASLCLKDCEFTDEEIAGLKAQTIPDMAPMNAKLAAHADVIERYSEAQLKYCVDGATEFINKYRVPFVDTAAILAIADTVNQYGSVGGGSASYLLALGRPVSAKDVLAMKLTWKYAKASKHNYDDTIRRYNNLIKVVTA
jgi:hypothetical protein